MSSNSSADVAIDPALIAELTQQFTYNQAFAYGELAGLVLLAYDTFLTLSDEISLIWRKKFHVVTILYFLARYGALGGLITFAIGILWPTTSPEADPSGIMQLTHENDTAGLLLGRAYAVSGGNKWVLASLSSLLLAYVGLSAVDAMLAAVICLSDAVTLGVTLYHTWREHRTLKKIAVDNSRSLTGLLLNQGILRFIIIFTYALENSISAKTLNPSIRGVEIFAENA
ncbi:hypothetical protein M422DRAFT_247694 [Sphaerobolus stellatus SS14]|nr:hypothetical protein M422DRAFT_247694 [Sphaerobolus stellatus SS14]